MSANFLHQESLPKVLIVSPPNFFTLALVDSLLANFCLVNILDNQDKVWKRNTSYLKENPRLTISRKIYETARPDYLIVNFLDGVDKSVLKTIIKFLDNNLFKTVLILPYSTKEGIYERLQEIRTLLAKPNLEVTFVYLGDLLGPRMNFDENKPFSRIIENILLFENIVVKNNGDFFPVFTADAAKEIVELLFSFGPPANEVVFYSEHLTSEALITRLQAVIKDKNFYLGGTEETVFHPNAYLINTPKKLEASLKEVFLWFSKNPVAITPLQKTARKEVKKIDISIPTVKLNLNFKTRLFYLVMSLLILFSVPLISLFLSAVILRTATKDLRGYQMSAGRQALIVSRSLASFSESVLNLYSAIPIAGRVFANTQKLAGIIAESDNVGIKVINVGGKASQFLAKIFGKEIYEPEDYSREIVLSLDDIYSQLGFLESELKAQKGFGGIIIQKNFDKLNLAEIRKDVVVVKAFLEKAPVILGATRPTSYLILFQNNMELRPTGGFIGSFAILTFDGGRLTNIDVQDVYSADGQLKGHIEPPAPINKYLGEANWYLRDANWDPDWPTTAARVEWFLGKEIDKSVDGVVGIDLEVAKRLLKITGPIKISDFNEVVSADDLYVKTQTETESQFFPGSIKKASFLSALTKELLDELINFNQGSATAFIQPLSALLKERHIQIFLHDAALQKNLSSLGYSGEVLIPSCEGNCYADWLGLVEANLGVNKVNYFIKRDISLEIRMGGVNLERQLTVSYDNSANPALGLGGIYKNYVRFLLPQEAETGAAFVGSGENLQTAAFDTKDVQGRKEIGLYLEVLPGEKKRVRVSWASLNPLNFNQKGEYRLYLRKQAGTLEDSVTVGYYPPLNKKVSLWPEISLTRGGASVYNTTLARDIFSRVSW